MMRCEKERPEPPRPESGTTWERARRRQSAAPARSGRPPRETIAPTSPLHPAAATSAAAAPRGRGIDMVSNANNHSLDFGPAAMLDMLRRLDRAGIAHAGAGANVAEARQAALDMTRDGTRIAVVSCTDNEPEWAAGDEAPGIHYVRADSDDPSARALTAEVRRLRSLADTVIVSTHWGGNWGYRPPLEHRMLGRALVQAGADIVFGHSCHVFRGVEVAGHGVIIYSAGDFVDDYAVDEVERNDWSFVFLVEVTRGRMVRLRLRPTVIRDLRACLPGDRLAQQIMGRMGELCRELGTPFELGDGEAVIQVPVPGGHLGPA